MGPRDGVVRHGPCRDAAIFRRGRDDAAYGRYSESYLRGASQVRRPRNGHVVPGAGPARPRRQLPGSHGFHYVRLRHAERRPAGLSSC